MQYREGIRKMGRVGSGLALGASILVFAGPASAAAQEMAPVHPYGHNDGDGRFSVHLTGDELQDGGDRGGRGAAWLDLDPEHERACYVTTWKGLDGAVTAFHLHAAPRRHDGPHWIDFFNDEHYDGEDDTVAGCVYSPRDKILDVIHNPSDYYLNLHTTAHEQGALRGQLG